MSQRVVYILADIDKAIAFEWVADLLDSDRFELSFILLNPGPSALEGELTRRGIPWDRVTYRGYRDLPRALWRTIRLLRRSRPETVHAHLLPANMVGLIAARLLRIPQRVYTRHHSTFHHDYAPRWVIIDRLLNSLATHVVASSENVRFVLGEMERVPDRKIRLVHHGFQFADFDNISDERVQALRERYAIGSAHPVVGIIARYIAWKGIEGIVEAARLVLSEYPNALFIFANARGASATRAAVQTLPPQNHLEIPFEHDLFALYRLFDVYVHTPIDLRIEAFGQTYVEALAAGVPSVFTLAGVGSEFIEHERNALVVPYQAPERTAEAILRILGDETLAGRIVEQGRQDVESRFQAQGMVDALSTMYREACRST